MFNRLSRVACSLYLAVGLFSGCTGEEATSTAEEPRSAGTHSIMIGGSSVRFDTIGMQRGDTAFALAILASDSNAQGATELVRADFTEIWQPGAGNVEQSWRFDRAPGHAGALTVTVNAIGLDYVNATSNGLEFRHAGEFDVRYSHGTWIDASGHRWAIPARFTNGVIVLTVPAGIIASSDFPATLDPIVIVTPILG